MPPNNEKLTRSATATRPRPLQLISEFGRPEGERAAVNARGTLRRGGRLTLAVVAVAGATGGCATGNARGLASGCSSPPIVQALVPGTAGESKQYQMNAASLAADLQNGLQRAVGTRSMGCPPGTLELDVIPGPDSRFAIQQVVQSSGSESFDEAILALVGTVKHSAPLASGMAGSAIRVRVRTAPTR